MIAEMNSSFQDHTIPHTTQEFIDDYLSTQRNDVPPEIIAVLNEGALTGNCNYQWESVRKIVIIVLEKIVDDFIKNSVEEKETEKNDNIAVQKKQIIENFEEFERVPFTYQRICELLKDPNKYYSKTSKFLQAISKVVVGITTYLDEDSDDDVMDWDSAWNASSLFKTNNSKEVKKVPSDEQGKIETEEANMNESERNSNSSDKFSPPWKNKLKNTYPNSTGNYLLVPNYMDVDEDCED